MNRLLKTTTVLKQIDVLEQKLVKLKRDVIHGLKISEKHKKLKRTLFGTVKGGDVTEEMIEESKQNLFRKLRDV